MARWDDAWLRRLASILVDLPFREPTERRAVRRALASDPVAFAVIYLGKHITAADGSITLAAVHRAWARTAEERIAERSPEPGVDRLVEVAPRETGKTTWWFLIIPLWAAANRHTRFFAAFAAAASQAEGHLATLKGELDTNPLLRNDYPELCLPLRRATGALVADRQGMLHMMGGMVFAARGIDSSVLGLKVRERRPDLIVLDDIEPDEASYSPELARKRLGTLRDAILPLNVYAFVALVGTVTMPGSAVHQAVQHAAGTRESEWVAEDHWTVRHHQAIVRDADGAERSLWERKWPIAWLQSIRHTRSYAKNYANDPMGREGQYWRGEDFRYGQLAGVTRVGLWVDPAVTTGERSDFTGLAIVEWVPPARTDADQALRRRDPGQCLVSYVREVKLTGRPLRKFVLALLAERQDVRLVTVETNQGGDLWREVFDDFPVRVRTHHATLPKEVRFAQALEYYQGGLVTHTQHWPDMELEAVSWPLVPHDDGLDATVAGVRHFLAPPDDGKIQVRRTTGTIAR